MSTSPLKFLTPSRARRTPRTPRSRHFKFSTTGTEVAHIETIEADPSLRAFPPILTSQIRQYLHAHADKGDEIELTFARNGNTKLNVSGEGFPASFVIPETNQKLDAGRYRYGLVKQSPLIVVVQQKADSSVPFNQGQPAIILYHGKHSSIDGPNKVSKWAVWSLHGIRADIIVWRIAEGARLVKTVEDANEETYTKIEEDEDDVSVNRSSPLVYGDARSIFKEHSHKRLLSQHHHSTRASPWMPVNDPYLATSDNVPQLQNAIQREGNTTGNGLTKIPIDPELLAQQNNTNSYSPATHESLSKPANNLHISQGSNTLTALYADPTESLTHHPVQIEGFHFFQCTCRGSVVERRNAEMAAATDKILMRGYSSIVNLHFRASINCETRETKTLEDCRFMALVFAYGRLNRTILLDHNVISVHFANATDHLAPCYLVSDDVDHWKTLMRVVEHELFVKEKAPGHGEKNVNALELVVLDEGY